MKKTVNANINKVVFHIDEDAYEKLSAYLQSLHKKFENNPGRDEIMSDIEGRIAEMLLEKIKDANEVVTLSEVEDCIRIMGEPDQVEDSESDSSATGKDETSQNHDYNDEGHRRLYRDPDNRILGGVAAGLAAFFSFKIVWVRLFFAILTFAYGIGPLVYLILWMVLPKANTTTEKLEMRGQKVNIANIEKSIRQEFGQVKDSLEDMSNNARHSFSGVGNALGIMLENLGSVLAVVFKYTGKVLAFLLGLVFVIAGVFLFTGLIATLLNGGELPGFSAENVMQFSLLGFFEFLFTTKSYSILAIIGLSLLTGIPLLMLIYAGFRLIFGLEKRLKFLGISFFLLWIAGFVMVLIVGIDFSRQFTSSAVKTSHIILQQPSNKSLYIKIDNPASFDSLYNNEHVWLSGLAFSSSEDKNLVHGKPRVFFNLSPNDSLYMDIDFISHGAGNENAFLNASSIRVDYHQNDSVFEMQPFFTIPDNAKFRNQRVRINLFIPANTTVFFDPSLETLISSWSVFPENSLYSLSSSPYKMNPNGEFEPK